MGFVWVDFDDQAFDDVRAVSFRGGPCADWYLGEHVVLMVRPLTLDLVSSEENGGPISSYQLRFGIGYRTRSRRGRLAVVRRASPASPARTSTPAPTPDEPVDPYGLSQD